MSAWTTAVSDLRNLLSDNPQDRPVFRKKVFGDINGTNLSFKTFEFRRLTNFSSAATPLGVFYNGNLLATSEINTDDPITGNFILNPSTTPVDGDILEASYYYQYFFDAELIVFLTNASQSFLQLSDDFLQVPIALREAALHYAASDALRKLALKWTERSSDSYLLEDKPRKESLSVADSFANLAKLYYSTATKMRDDSYATRSGQALAPNFKSNFGRVGAVVPRR